MKKGILLLLLMTLTALLLTGCAMQTVEEMYALPKRSEEFNEMQKQKSRSHALLCLASFHHQ